MLFYFVLFYFFSVPFFFFTFFTNTTSLLISDETTDKAAASMDVNVGHMSDPDHLPGLAHFLEQYATEERHGIGGREGGVVEQVVASLVWFG